MKHLKYAAALLLSLTLLFSFVCPALAAETAQEGLTLETDTILLAPGDSFDLSSAILISDAYTPSQIKYQSSDTKIAKVSSSGHITAVAEGIALITAFIPKTDDIVSCTVKVSYEDSGSLSNASVSGVLYDVSEKPINNGMLQLQSNSLIVPSPNAELQKNGSFSYQDLTPGTYTLLLVSPSGKINASGALYLSPGENQIAVEQNSLDLTIKYGSTELHPLTTSLQLSNNDISMQIGETTSLQFTQNGTDVVPQGLTPTVSDSSVASIDNSYQIQALAPGETDVVLSDPTGSINLTCHITVNSAQKDQLSAIIIIVEISLILLAVMALVLFYRSFLRRKIRYENRNYKK